MGGQGRRKAVPRTSSFRTVAVLTLIPLGAFIAYFAYQFFRAQEKFLPRPKRSERQAERAAAMAPPSTPAPPRPHRQRHGEIVLILDDVGFDHQPLERAMTIDPNVNFSILPNAAHAAEFARTLHRNSFQVLCHLPMEPVGYPRQSPGPKAVMTSMSDEEIARVTREDIAAIPYAAGVNNHMGSRATADAHVMRSVLGALPRGMFFIDSMTTSASIAGRTAREMGIPTASRQVFLDDVQSEAAIRRQLGDLTAAAAERGMAVGIGHMYPVTIRVLAAEAPALREQGFRFVHASDAVD